MTILIELLENLIKDDNIVKKQIRIDDRNINVFVETKENIIVEFSFNKRLNNSQHDEMIKQIEKLIRYDVEPNLPF